MLRVISKGDYKRWCKEHALDLASCSFHIETCYYGRGIRSRPGAILVRPGIVTHRSYHWTDTLWAAGEPAVRVDMPIAEISTVAREPLSLTWKLMFLGAREALVIKMVDGTEHFLVLQRRLEECERAIADQRQAVSTVRPLQGSGGCP